MKPREEWGPADYLAETIQAIFVGVAIAFVLVGLAVVSLVIYLLV